MASFVIQATAYNIISDATLVLYQPGLICRFDSVLLQSDEISFEEGDILYIVDRVT